MIEFCDVLWGYKLTYPQDWAHLSIGDSQTFAAVPEALEGDYDGPRSGRLLIQPEWNPGLLEIGPLWTQHIGRFAGLIGASQVGSAPWALAGARGLEAEVRLPKRDRRRMWTGILTHRFLVLKMMVVHLVEERTEFQPAFTRLIGSLGFPESVPEALSLDPPGIALPPNVVEINPGQVLPDIGTPENWRAFTASGSMGALQAFFMREVPAAGWNIEGYDPFPSTGGPGFARFFLRKESRAITIGILPPEADPTHGEALARIVLKLN
jgi:hypothetical protein